MAKLTPRQKKKLSLERDRRNCYGESPHGARKVIPRRKRWRSRGYRHETRQQLNGLSLRADPELAEEIQSKVAAVKPRRWKKYRDTPLGVFIESSREMREKRANAKSRTKTRK